LFSELPGAAYVFVQTGNTWNQEQKFSNGVPDDLFGWDVAIGGETIAVVEHQHDGPVPWDRKDSHLRPQRRFLDRATDSHDNTVWRL
jgi:hypothetical protein